MLKIKDNVDLKELEKFGFIKTIEDDEHTDGYELEETIKRDYRYLIIPSFNREIVGNHLNKIYDLIKADLVEKV